MNECPHRGEQRDGRYACAKAAEATGVRLYVNCANCTGESACAFAIVDVLSRRVISRTTRTCCGHADMPLSTSLRNLKAVSPEAAERALLKAVSVGMPVEDAVALATEAGLDLDKSE